MPIKPENRGRYPPDWQAIRSEIMTRAGHRCEHPGCGARNYSVGWWQQEAGRHWWLAAWGQHDNPRTYAEARQVAAETYFETQGMDGPKPIVIVLTIGHVDHQPENCDPANLRAWCQRHHLQHDAAHHAATAQATRQARKAIGDLFATPGATT